MFFFHLVPIAIIQNYNKLIILYIDCIEKYIINIIKFIIRLICHPATL